jgi:hypothetical protein
VVFKEWKKKQKRDLEIEEDRRNTTMPTITRFRVCTHDGALALRLD